MIDTPVLCCEIIKVLLFRYSSYLLLTSATSWLSARGKLFSVEMLSCTEPNLPWDLVTNISDVNSIQPPAVSGMWETLIQKSLRESKRNTHKDRKKKIQAFQNLLAIHEIFSLFRLRASVLSSILKDIQADSALKLEGVLNNFLRI